MTSKNTIRLNSFKDFEEIALLKIKKVRKEVAESSIYQSNVLFRGHAEASWKLETTLERYLQREKLPFNLTWERYFWILKSLEPAIESFTDKNWLLKASFRDYEAEYSVGSLLGKIPPAYNFMAYLRHHGFPSPLLDWTLSPYVAAYFAYRDAGEDDVAIHLFQEYAGSGKCSEVTKPTVLNLGHFIATHKRHHTQQSEYTICTRLENGICFYASHEDGEYGSRQDILEKYVLPSSERKEILKRLDMMNINEFTLFGSEEGLISTLAARVFESKI